jgi:hypothetical protein
VDSIVLVAGGNRCMIGDKEDGLENEFGAR